MLFKLRNKANKSCRILNIYTRFTIDIYLKATFETCTAFKLLKQAKSIANEKTIVYIQSNIQRKIYAICLNCFALCTHFAKLENN